MKLLDLPNELLDQIIQLVVPEGFESLALSCKHLYELSDKHRKIYNPRRSIFRHFNYYNCNRIETDAELLQAIAAAPTIARYITTADFIGPTKLALGYQVDGVYGFLTTSPLLSSKFRELFDDALVECVAKENTSLSYRAEYHLGRFLMAFAPLLVMPNVTELNLPIAWREVRQPESDSLGTGSDVIWELLDSMVQETNASIAIPHSSALPRSLRRILPMESSDEESATPP